MHDQESGPAACPLQVACESLGPLKKGGRVIGVDLQETKRPDKFCDERVTIVQAGAGGGRAGVAVQCAALQWRLKRRCARLGRWLMRRAMASLLPLRCFYDLCNGFYDLCNGAPRHRLFLHLAGGCAGAGARVLAGTSARRL